MAKVRLTEWMRDRLRGLASESVNPVAEAEALAGAYAVAAPLVRAIVEAKYPPRDMKVCAKYDTARRDDCINVSMVDGVWERFCFAKGTGPLVPSTGSCQTRMYLADAAASAAVEAWSDATKALKVERDRRLAAYRALIATSRNLDEVVAVWPAASVIAPVGNLPAVLDAEQQAIIAADLHEREAA